MIGDVYDKSPRNVQYTSLNWLKVRFIQTLVPGVKKKVKKLL